MHHHFDQKTAIAAVLLVATSWVGAQTAEDTTPSTPGSMNSTTSPNPLQTRPADGTPNSATGSQTPGTGTGSSRTMRNPTTDSSIDSQPSTTTTPSSDMRNDSMNNSNIRNDSMNNSNSAPMGRPARRDRG